jgi:hypothetical protein
MQPRNRRKDLLCAVAVLLLAVANWAGRLAGPVDLRWDAGTYYTLGTSLYEGKGYRLLNEPGEVRANQYPPLLPAIVAVHQMITGTTDPFIAGNLMRRSWMVLYVLYIPGVFWLAKRFVGRPLAIVVALITLLNPQSTFLSETGFAELPFALASLVFFLVQPERSRARSTVAFIAATACYLLRTIGIALLAAWILDAVRQRRFRSTAVRAALAMIPVVAWQTYVHSVETSAEYQRPTYAYQRADYMFYNVSYAVNISLKDPFHPADGRATFVDIAKRSLGNLRPLTFALAESVSSSNDYWHWELDWTGRWLPRLGPAILVRGSQLFLTMLILLGFSRLFHLEPSMVFYASVSFLIVAIAPWPSQYIRYLSPMAPYIAIALVLGLGMVSRLLPQKWGAWLTAIVLCLVLVQQAISFFLLYRREYKEVTEVAANGQRVRFRLFYYDEGFRSLDAAQDWLRQQTHTTDVIASGSPHWLSLRTGRRAVMVPFGGEPPILERLLASVPVNYFVYDDIVPVSLSSFALPAIEHSPEWRQVFTFGGHCRVFERIGSGIAGAVR